MAKIKIEIDEEELKELQVKAQELRDKANKVRGRLKILFDL